ncbi:MAG: prolipoprotein diacylglyceryl transferase [Bacillota bacterium]|nr:prolipoprotein diacylglyceryl transferase [Bacillota bacterium]
MKVLFSIGPVPVYFFGLMIAAGIIAGVWFAIKTAKKKQISEDTILNLAITVVTAGVIGARVFYILFYNPSYYLSHPSEILSINEGGMSIHGGIFLALTAGVIFSKKNKISFFKLADITVIAAALAQGIGRVGCDVFGKAMVHVMHWGVKVNSQILHPAQVYEFILDYLLFIYLWGKSEKQKYDGQLFVTYIIAFPVIRGIVEFFRINPVIWGPFSISHLLSLLFIAAGLIIYKFAGRNKQAEFNNEEASVNLAQSLFGWPCY